MIKTVTTAGKKYKKGADCPVEYEKDWLEAGYCEKEKEDKKAKKEG